MYNKQVETCLTPELTCSNIKTSIAFYVGTLEFKIQYNREEEGFVMLERQGSRIMLDEIKTSSSQYRSWIVAPLDFPFGRGINLQMKTTDVEGFYKHVLGMGANIFLPIEIKWYRAYNMKIGLRQFIVLDPDGYMLRFFEELGE